MNHSPSGIIITGTAESKVEGNLKLVLVSQLSGSLSRKLDTETWTPVFSTEYRTLLVPGAVRLVRLAILWSGPNSFRLNWVCHVARCT